MRFRDREEAGRKLARALAAQHLVRPVVLGIPRGGVPLAVEVAHALDGELGVVVARKLRAPLQPECAIGAVSADGEVWLDDFAARYAGADNAYLEREIARQKADAARREKLFHCERGPELRGRVVVVVDDGIATGATAMAALRSVRKRGAARSILAVPVAPPSGVERLRREADEVLCLSEEPDFWAVGQFYDHFEPVEDSMVVELLEAYARAPRAAPSADPVIEHDGIRLAARLELPGGAPPFPAVIFVHGAGSSMDSPRNVEIAQELRSHGFATLLFDLSGHGRSQRPKRPEPEAYVADCAAAFRWARARRELDPRRVVLCGSSLGAWVALRAVVTEKLPAAALVLRGPAIAPEDLAGLKTPSLVVIGSEDSNLETIGDELRRRPRIDVAIIPGATHLMPEPGALEASARSIAQYLEEHVKPRAATSTA